MKSTFAILAALAAATASVNAQASVQITEVMYTGLFGEFVEITNVGTASAFLNTGTGWTFSDNSRGTTAGVNATSLAQIGELSVNESAIITEVSDEIFIQAWYTEPTNNAVTLAASNIVENNSINLGRGDEVNINDETGASRDRLTYTDQSGLAANVGPRSEDVSAIPELDDTSATFSDWTLSVCGLVDFGWKAGVAGAPGPIGSPGKFPNFR